MTTPLPVVLLTHAEVAQLAVPPSAPQDARTARERWQVPAGRYADPVTQAAFAALLGVPAATVRDWEQGRRTPDAAAARLLALFTAAPVEMRAALVRLAANTTGNVAVP